MVEVSTRLHWIVQSLIAFVPYLLSGLLAGSLVLAVSVWLARHLLWDWLLPFEESLLLALKDRANPVLDRYMTGLSLLAQGEVTLPLLVLIGGILVYCHEAVSALILAIVLSGSWLLNGIFKSLFRRQRPDLWASSKRPMDYSYPSGHSMSAISFYGLLAVYLTHWLSIPLSMTLAVAGGLSTGVGFSRLYFGVHWPTDVLSGWLAGCIWLVACLYGLVRIGALH